MHIPINQQVIINNVYASTQGIIDNGFYGFEKFSW
jgi:hypothetical protein